VLLRVAVQVRVPVGLIQAMADGEPILVKGGPLISHHLFINHLHLVAQQAVEAQPQQLLYEAMMYYQFLHLATKGIMYGTFVNSMNETKRIAYTKDHISYLDHLAEYKI
jgi:hypothetical protein